MGYFARYSVLGEYGLEGIEDYDFEAFDDEEAKEIALQHETDYSAPKRELLLDSIEDEDGNEIEWER